MKLDHLLNQDNNTHSEWKGTTNWDYYRLFDVIQCNKERNFEQLQKTYAKSNEVKSDITKSS